MVIDQQSQESESDGGREPRAVAMKSLLSFLGKTEMGKLTCGYACS